MGISKGTGTLLGAVITTDTGFIENERREFSLRSPAEPASLVVDSGGFQAATRWNGSKACERGLHGRYPYSPTELHDWAEEIGADVVAGMDVACETAIDLFGADGLENSYIWPGDYRDRLLESLEY
jgi:hypothetical protein